MPSKAEFPVDETLCRNCGKCCYKKFIIGKRVYITPFPCEFLDVHTNLCTIYEQRHKLNPTCLSVPKGLKHSSFPADCPYVKAHAKAGYKPASENYDWSDDWKDFETFADDAEVSPAMRALIKKRGPDAPPLYAETFARLRRKQKRNEG